MRDLLARPAGSDVIVYVEPSGSSEIPVARTKLVATSARVRYLRIGINHAE